MIFLKLNHNQKKYNKESTNDDITHEANEIYNKIFDASQDKIWDKTNEALNIYHSVSDLPKELQQPLKRDYYDDNSHNKNNSYSYSSQMEGDDNDPDVEILPNSPKSAVVTPVTPDTTPSDSELNYPKLK